MKYIVTAGKNILAEIKSSILTDKSYTFKDILRMYESGYRTHVKKITK